MSTFGPGLRASLPLLYVTAALVACGVTEIVPPMPASSGGSGVVANGGQGGTNSGPPPSSAGGTSGNSGGGPAGAGGTAGPPVNGGGGGGMAGLPTAGTGGTAPPVETAGVTIGGNFVPRSKVVVFLHIGHSNMAGRATGPADLKPFFYNPDPQLWVYGKAGFNPAKEPTAPDNQAGQAAGPGMAILHAAAAAAAPGTYVISIGHGHSGSFAGYCSNFRKGGLFYDVVMGPALQLKGKVTFGAIFTMFGQSEHNVDVAQQHLFSECMKGVAGDMRADLAEPDLPYMVGDYEMGISREDIAPTSAFAMGIIAQIKMIPGKTPRTLVIPTEGLMMEDNHHFNMAGHKEWAARGIKMMVDQGWAPWAAPR